VGAVTAPVVPIETRVAETAGLFSVTVHIEFALVPSVDGLHATLVNCSGAVPVSVNDCETLLSVATISAV
jgi:hypothetical protein